MNDIKSRLKSAQAKAAVMVNSALIEFYWWLGQNIVVKKREHKWGDSVVKQLSLDLKAEFPDQKGLSYTNLKYTVQVYMFYSKGLEFGQQAVGQIKPPKSFLTIPWGHHIQIISKCKDVQEALFYINKTIDGNWSRNRLTSALISLLFGKSIMKKNWKTHWSAISRVFYELEHIVDRALEDSGTEYGYVRRRNYE